MTGLITFLPELIVAGGAMLFLMLGAFTKPAGLRVLIKAAAIFLTVPMALLLQGWDAERVFAFSNMLTSDNFAVMVKIMLVGSTIAVLLMAHGTAQKPGWLQFEFIVLLMTAMLGMMLMVSAYHLLALYMAMELMSLSLYVLASMRRDTLLSSEAGLKYFVLGALASGLFLFGVAYIYGFTGTLQYNELAARFGAPGSLPIGVLFGIILVLTGLFFKISAAPFHMWTPDVYQGAPTLVTAFFSAAPKIAGLAVLVRFLMQPWLSVAGQWQQVIIVVAVASMLVGALAALRQTNIKRLLAYSSIGHVGYVLVGIAAGNITAIQSMLVYGFIYVITTLGMFTTVLLLKRKGEPVEGLDDLKGLGKTQPLLAAVISVLMLSMAGIPPFAGFFGKFYVFFAAIEEDLFYLAVIGVLTSVIGAFYYLKIIKLMYFDDVVQPLDNARVATAHKLVLAVSSLFTIGLFIYPTPLTTLARMAARSLLN